MHTSLAALALCPQATKAHLEIRDLGQGLLVQLSKSWSAVLTDSTFGFAYSLERKFTAHARLGLCGELHETTNGGRYDGDCAGMVAGH
jgi:hypothetical protein